MNIIFFSFLFFLPAGVANMVPVFAAKIPGLREWNYPLDFGKKFRGKRILGDHKTIRGLVLGVACGMAFCWIEYSVILTNAVRPEFFQTNPWLLGFLLSFGALFGDSVKSFFKRQTGITSGKSWFPFDQIDYILGGIIFSLFALQLPLIYYLIIFLLYFFLHLGVSYIGFLLKLKSDPI